MRFRHLTTAALALGLVLLTDVLRVWLPSIITIFGQAASTPAELMGAFALGCFLLALVAPPLVRRIGVRRVTLAAAVLLAGIRLALTAAPGGRAQLWLATAGLLVGLLWLAGVAAGTPRPVPGLAVGLALAAVGHALLDTYDLVWRGGWLAWSAGAVLVALFLATAFQDRPTAPAPAGGGRAWLLAGPGLLLAGMVALSPALAGTAMSYWYGPAAGIAGPPPLGLALAGGAVGLFVLAALAPARRWWPAAPVALLLGALLFALDRPALLVPALLLTAVGLGGCLARTDAPTPDTEPEPGAEPGPIAAPAPGAEPAPRAEPARAGAVTVGAGVPASGAAAGPPAPPATVGAGGPGDGATPRPARADLRRGYAAVGGMLVFAVAAVGYYAAYDLGYPNGWAPVAAAALVAGVAVTAPAPRPPATLPPVRTAAVLAAVTLLAAWGHGPWLVSSNRPGPPETVRLVAYNVRMGFGLDGRFDLAGLARVVRAERPDVVVLSEVDRAWLLNGGHDTLTLLAKRLDMPYVFAPAADPVWGDAVLSRWPTTSPRTRALPAVGAPTGAQALAVDLDLGGGVRLAVVSTHLQPPPDQEPVVQARAVAEFATGYAAGRPLVVAGDLNTEPGEAAFAEFTRAGLVDALAAARPLPTSPADDPRQQIDHVLVSAGLAASDPVAPRSEASDHLPVAVTLTLP
ncbi:endonuclease/exonuclease/phosphatase family protein [Micromonospora sp. C28SCA-DRY-2]|uniref:endonuclease/exonuclease/phosphatase family protein n=1 Tax=Micromonospora sp. C28SCA-DRY-2 TaxID=3059522 RepID=UPI002676BBDB|nr:endonuclease/exonuclease/phosphatase family protein [Micromonospora sp. C28SCA-DRY-2]MDO3700725.1 endonuclease/exonuclease/phosphatase family protein [Micromonospora sp. C28SCA-DRY-2]